MKLRRDYEASQQEWGIVKERFKREWKVPKGSGGTQGRHMK